MFVVTSESDLKKSALINPLIEDELATERVVVTQAFCVNGKQILPGCYEVCADKKRVYLEFVGIYVPSIFEFAEAVHLPELPASIIPLSSDLQAPAGFYHALSEQGIKSSSISKDNGKKDRRFEFRL